MTKHNSQFFNTFTLEGTYTGSVTKGESEDWKAMSKRVNESLEQLAQKEWSGYKTVTAYFVNYRVNSSNEFEYDVVFHGIAKDDGENKAPTVNINGPYSGLVKREFNLKVMAQTMKMEKLFLIYGNLRWKHKCRSESSTCI